MSLPAVLRRAGSARSPGLAIASGDRPDELLVPELMAQHYDDFRTVARRIIANDGQRHGLQATELVNEAMVRLISANSIQIDGGAHLLALAARTMRRVLIDEARKAASLKRQSPELVTSWPDDPRNRLIDLGELDRSLIALERVSPSHAEVVELRFMLGLTVDEASRASGIPGRTIKRRWQAARAWLLDYLQGNGISRL